MKSILFPASMKKSWTFSNKVALEEKSQEKATGSSKSTFSHDALNSSGTSLFHKLFSKTERARSKTMSEDSRSLKPKISDSVRPDQSDYNIGKSVKIKGGHLKNGNSFDGLFLAQDLSFELLDRKGITRSNSVRSLQSTHDTPSQQGIWIMKFSRDGSFLAAGRNDGVVLVWKRYQKEMVELTPRLSVPIAGSIPNIQITDFGDGMSKSLGYLDYEYPASNDASLSESQLFQNQPFRIFKAHNFAITDLSWSSGDFLISSSLDSTVRLWHVDHSECLCTFQHSDCVASVEFHPFDNGIFISGSLDGRIRMWDLIEKKILHWNDVPRDAITAVSFNRDGSIIIAGTLAGNCVFYDSFLKYNTQIAMSQKYSKQHKVTGIQVMPATSAVEEKILVTTTDSKLRLVNLRDKSLYRTYKGIELRNNRAAATFSSDGEYIIVSTDDKYVSIWDTLPEDANQQYSGVLSAVIHRQIDAARQSGQERFIASNHNITWATFAPWKHLDGTSPHTELSGTAILVSDDHGHIYIYKMP
jgi:WD40 repeat protein